MKNILTANLYKYQDEGLLILRILLGLVLMYHGYVKIAGGMHKIIDTGSAMAYIGITGGYFFFGALATFCELIGGIFIIVGLFYRLFAFLMVGTLFVASVMQLGAHGYDKASHAMDLMFAYIGMLIAGPGKYSLDYKWFHK